MRGFGFRFGDVLTVELQLLQLELPIYNDVQDGTVMARQAIPPGGHRNAMTLRINGQESSDALESGLTFMFGDDKSQVKVHLPGKDAKHDRDAPDGPVLVISTPSLKLVIYAETEEVLHFDMHLAMLGGISVDSLHGVLGQTARWHWATNVVDRVLEGTEQDYETKGLLDSSFKFNTFGKAAVNNAQNSRARMAMEQVTVPMQMQMAAWTGSQHFSQI